MRCRHFDCFAYICRVSNKQNETMKKQLLMLAVLFGLTPAVRKTTQRRQRLSTPLALSMAHGESRTLNQSMG